MRVLILGYGKTGHAVENFLLSKKIEYSIYDQNVKSLHGIELKDLLNIDSLFDICVRSPGIPCDSEVYLLAQMVSKKIVSEIQFAFYFLNTKTKIIGVTGSNGKTTVCTMLKEVFMNSKEFKNVYLLGNGWEPLISNVNRIAENDLIILELSSFQLENTYERRIDYGVLTNISENHLNAVPSYLFYLISKHKMRMLTKNDNFIEEEKEGFSIKLPISNFKFAGEHNQKHLQTVVKIAIKLELTTEYVLQKLVNYTLLPYRQSSYYLGTTLIVNDSKCTSVASLKASLQTFKNEKSLLILGGIYKSKGIENIDTSHVQDIKFFGKDGKYLSSLLQQGKVYKTLKDLIFSIDLDDYNLIIFSPSCSSFDQYESFIDRGKDFDQLIKEHYEEH